jgi:hypothetical protein
VWVGRDLDGQAAAVGGPGEQSLLNVVERDRPGVVVGGPVLLLGAPVPGVPALVGEADQGVAVEPLQGLSGHGVLLRVMRKPDPGRDRAEV